MKELLDRRTEGFSQGERMKTALARALVHDPANIVLDEPTNGLDVLATRALREVLRHLRSPAGGSKCIVFSSHIMQEVERLCDSVVVVSQGRTVATGTVAELLAAQRALLAYADVVLVEITEVRVQRLQDITEADARAEGVTPAPFCKSGRPSGMEHVEAFEDLWDEINGDRATWASNPWVWAISFRRVP